MSKKILRAGAGALSLAACANVAAQSAGTLAPVTITGNPLGATDVVAPAHILSGSELMLRSQGSLGETLSGLPGVSSTWFGPAASRPMIRGLDGDRVRVLSNSGAMGDVSSLSYDHAVAADPITVERIEILRGPAALQYGGNAIGGVVNMIDNRIPRAPLRGVSGKVDAGVASGNRERSGAALLETGNDRFAFHGDVFGRSSGDVRVPVELPCARDGVTAFARRLCNSVSDSSGGALGGTVFLPAGYLGASLSGHRSDYGSVAEDEVAIAMRSRRLSIEGELRELGGWFQGVKLQAGHNTYRHLETDAGVPGTLFRQRGHDIRLEARHRRIGALDGVWGLQLDASRFSAAGDEAFAPDSRTRQHAAFVFEELATSWGRLSGGARMEDVRVESLGNPDVPHFTTGERRFRPRSASVAALWNVAPAWQLTLHASHSERAPKDYELFADGPHVATGAYEVGNPALGKERSRNLEAGLRWKSGPHSLQVGAFASRFRNYIALTRTGALRGDDLLPEYAYAATTASFHGLEASGTWRALAGASQLDLDLRGDMVRARDSTTGEPLPRIAPARIGVQAVFSRGPWSARIAADHNAAQRRVPQGDVPVGASTLVSAAITWRMAVQDASLLWSLRVTNATDRLAYSASSILTQSQPGRVPLPGRSLRLGLRAEF